MAGSKKIGRNAPCPCGSGKKYKKCCLKVLTKRSGLRTTTEGMWEWMSDREELVKGFELLKSDLYIGEGSEWEDTFKGVFLFGHPLPSGKQPYEIYLEEIDAPVWVRETLGKTLFSVFEVVDTEPGFAFSLKDIVRGGEYRVLDKDIFEKIEIGTYVYGRIAPISGSYVVISPYAWRLPESFESSIEDILNTAKLIKERELYEVEIAAVLLTDPEYLGEWESGDPEYETDDPWTEGEPFGETEHMLLGRLDDEIRTSVRLDDYPSVEEAKKAGEELFCDWMETPQEDLDGKTPEEAIRREREERGVTSEEIFFNLLHPVLAESKPGGRIILDLSLDELIKAYEEGDPDRPVYLDILEEKLKPFDEVIDLPEDRYRAFPSKNEEPVILEMQSFGLTFKDFGLTEELANIVEGNSPHEEFREFLEEKNLEYEWKDHIEYQNRNAVLTWLGDMGLDLKGRPYLDDLDIEELNPEELAELGPEIKGFQPERCLDCGYSEDIEGRFLRLNIAPDNSLLRDAVEHIVYERFGITDPGYFIYDLDLAYLTAAQCPECGSRDIFWDF